MTVLWPCVLLESVWRASCPVGRGASRCHGNGLSLYVGWKAKMGDPSLERELQWNTKLHHSKLHRPWGPMFFGPCFSMNKHSQITINCLPSSHSFSSPEGVMACASATRQHCHLPFVPAVVRYGGTFMSDASLQNITSWSSLDQGLKHKQYVIACRWLKTWICFIYASWKDVIQYAVGDLNVYSEQFPDKM